jgi:hypothetical protein
MDRIPEPTKRATFRVDSINSELSSTTMRPTARMDSMNSQLSGAFEYQPTRTLDSQKNINRKLKMGWTPRPGHDTSDLRRTRHVLAALAVQTYPAIKDRFTKISSPGSEAPSRQTYEPLLEQLVVRNARNWPSDFLLPGLGGELMGMTLWFATMGYGGVHIAAWHEYFPTRTEQLLWRMSSIYIASSSLL